MPFKIVRADITELNVDAIVNPSNKQLLPTGGLNLVITKKAGSALEAACKALSPCQEGQIKVTNGYKLPCKYIFHTAGPVWKDGNHNEGELLASCYRNALKKAQEMNLESIAFPLIATGNNLFPKDLALSVATNEIANFILKNDLTVYLVVFDKASYQISTQRFDAVAAYIDDNYAESVKENRSRNRSRRRLSWVEELEEKEELEAPTVLKAPTLDDELAVQDPQLDVCYEPMRLLQEKSAKSLDELLSQLDESFSDMLLRKIHERHMTAVECYKRANIDKKLFSKIQSNRYYHPKKTTVLAFAIALQLSLEETSEMLQKAGFALSRSNKADIIVQYYLQNQNYNIFEINETLFAFDQQLIGG